MSEPYTPTTEEIVADHDRRIRRDALTLNSNELFAVCQMVLGSTPNTFHISGPRMALEALAEAREDES